MDACESLMISQGYLEQVSFAAAKTEVKPDAVSIEASNAENNAVVVVGSSNKDPSATNTVKAEQEFADAEDHGVAEVGPSTKNAQ